MKKDLKGYEDYYEIELLENGQSIISSKRKLVVSKNGTKKWRVPKELTPFARISNTNGNNYMYVNLCAEGKVKTFVFAKLVLDHFVENPKGYTYFKYKDGDTSNTSVDNLEWITDTERFDYYKNKDSGYGSRTKGIRCRNSKIGTRFRTHDGGTAVSTNRFSVTISYKRKKYSIGTFRSEDDAVTVRDYFEGAVKYGEKMDIWHFDLDRNNVIFHDDLKQFFTNENNLPW